MANITLFAQAINKLPKESIRKIVRDSKTDKHSKGYDTWSQFISMMFCQFSGCDSVRDISNGLNSANGNLNHLGICRAPSKSTVAYQNANRDSSVFRPYSMPWSLISDSRRCGNAPNSVSGCQSSCWTRQPSRWPCRSTNGRTTPQRKAQWRCTRCLTMTAFCLNSWILQMGARQSCRIAQTEHIHKNRTRQVAGRSLHSSARASGGRINMSQKGLEGLRSLTTSFSLCQ